MTSDKLWYKKVVIYELHVRSFYDSSGDGVGDFNGLAQKLDYLEDLGVDAIWLLPFYPSPLKDGGYDISDYCGVHPMYGDLNAFKHFLHEAHKRGLKVITELVLNHTSSEHKWFQEARRAPQGSKKRDFYVWSSTPDKYKNARIIFKDFETSNWAYDNVTKAYYWHRFYSHQPDLNYENTLVHKAIFEIVDFWFSIGVDGLRLDAVPYLYEEEGTSCENLPKTHEFLKKLRNHIDNKFKNKMLLAEANQWPEDAAAYFGKGDECHMNFHFPLMPRIFMSLSTGDRYPIIDILRQTPQIPDNCQWATFLRNHDELTLEMVSDEERDFMYRYYSSDERARINLGIRRRLAPLLGNNRRQIELVNSLLFSLPGTPILYYGDEIGMGDNIYLGDRDGVRTPMQWSPDRNAGFSKGNPQSLYLPLITDPEYHYETVNVETRNQNQYSLLWWMKKIIKLRKRMEALQNGDIEILEPENRAVLCFIRKTEKEKILVTANLSKHTEYVELPLPQYKNFTPLELFGNKEFPAISDPPYFLTLGPHAFYWFSLISRKSDAINVETKQIEIDLKNESSESIFIDKKKESSLTTALKQFLPTCRWYAGKGDRIEEICLIDYAKIKISFGQVFFLLIKVNFYHKESQLYFIPVCFGYEKEMEKILSENPQRVILKLINEKNYNTGIMYDAIINDSFTKELIHAFKKEKRIKCLKGVIKFSQTKTFENLYKKADVPLSTLLKAEQSNSSIVYGTNYILKLFRQFSDEANPELEFGRYLTEKREFKFVPKLLGAIEYSFNGNKNSTLGVLNEYVTNVGNAWNYTLDNFRSYLDKIPELKNSNEYNEPIMPFIEQAFCEKAPAISKVISPFDLSIKLMGKRIAELHKELSSDSEDEHFCTEQFFDLYRRSIYQNLRTLNVYTQDLVKRNKSKFSPEIREKLDLFLKLVPSIDKKFKQFVKEPISGYRIRIHGDLHLGQILHTGNDFVILDFEGEPLKAMSERKLKRSPLKDVAPMIRSFDYATNAVFLLDKYDSKIVQEYLPWAKRWYHYVSAQFLKGYIEEISNHAISFHKKNEIGMLIEIFLLEKALYEVCYEIEMRPDWIPIPINGIIELLESKIT